MTTRKPLPVAGRRPNSFYRFMRAVVMVVFVFASPFLSAPTPSFAQNSSAAAATPQLPGVSISHGPLVKPIERNVDLRSLPTQPASTTKKIFPHPLESGFHGVKSPISSESGPASSAPQTSQSSNMPAPIVSFKGLDFNTWGAGHPPDTVGDVGPNIFVQAVNTSIGVFNKTTGSSRTDKSVVNE